MAEENAPEGLTKPRQVLGDLTNLLGKRGSSEMEKKGVKSSNFSNKDSAKRIRVSSPVQSEIHSPRGNTLSSIPNPSEKNKDTNMNQFRCQFVSKTSSDLDGDIDNDDLLNVNLTAGENFEGPNLTEENEIPDIDQIEFVNLKGNKNDLKINEGSQVQPGSSKESKVVENIGLKVDDELSDALVAAAETGGFCLDNDCGFDVYESKGSQSDANEYHHHHHHHHRHHGYEHNLVSSQCGSVDCVNFLPGSQEFTVFGVEKFMDMKNGNTKCVSEGTKPTRTGSCSFCTKAGYMWLDLNYQDIKARVPALKKIQKEAIVLAERIIRIQCIERRSVKYFRSSTIQSDLLYQWVSLFQHMAGIMEQESNQLDGRLVPLNYLREKCKRDLESIGDDRSEEH